MSYNNYTYVVVDSTDSLNYDLLLNRPGFDLPTNKDGTKKVVKYSGNKPSFLEGKITYTHEEIMDLLKTESWLDDDPEGV